MPYSCSLYRMRCRTSAWRASDRDRRPIRATREVAFAHLLASGEPVSIERIARDLGTSAASVEAATGALGAAGWLDRDEGGRITGAAGLSLSSGAHRVEIGGREFRTRCASDALGIPAALGVDATATRSCGVCGTTLTVPIHRGDPEGGQMLWMSAGGDDLRDDFCTPTVLRCSEVHGREWGRRRADHGRLLVLATAADEGRQRWAGCARAARRLGHAE